METNKVVRSSDITLRIGLDEKNIPTKIEWKAEDSPDTPKYKEVKAMLLSVFDKEFMDTYKIDLWTNELQINEMDKFMYQTLRGLADTYFKATNNEELANDMRKFVQYFGEKTEVIVPE
ncbi:MAG: gliding motility protein GldC [Saprospiraceae bacterium]|nr:gliding motility protein GldC [Saprospiraceae bacterium]